MNYIADNYLSQGKVLSKETKVFYSVYQQLGLLWEFLGCRCGHWDGHRKKGNNLVCKICGNVKGTKERYYVLPLSGVKVIGRMVRPGKDRPGKLFKKAAEIINDSIKFHGAQLNVSVFHGYPSKWDKIGEKINIAADRIVTLKESDLIFERSKYIASMRITSARKRGPIYGGFLSELPQRILKKMPILLSYDKYGKLVEIELLR